MSAVRILLVGLALVACAARRYEAKPIEARGPAEAFAARSLDDPELAALARPAAGEAPVAGALSWDFEALTRVALALRPELALARAEIEQARAALVTAGVRPNPSFAVTPEIVPGASDPWILGWILDIPFETAGKRGLRVDAAEARLRAEEFRVPLAAWAVRVEVRRALDELAAARAEAGQVARIAALEGQRQALERARLEAGASDRTALARAQQSLVRAESELEESRARQARALSALAQALALPRAALESATLEATIDSGAPAAWPAPPEAGAARELALVNRLDLSAGLAEYAAAEADLRLEIARQYPDFRLAPGWTYDQGDHKLALGFAIELPIFDRNQGPIAEAEARRTASAARFQVLEESALGRVESARVAYAEALASHGRRVRAEALAEAEWRRVEHALAEGAVDRLARIEAELAWLALGRASAEAQAEVARTRLELEDALQRPLAAEAKP